MLKTIQLTRNSIKSLNAVKSTYSNFASLTNLPAFSPIQILSTQNAQIRDQEVIFASKRFYASKKLKSGKSGSHKPKVELTKEELDSCINYNELMRDMKHAIEHLKNDYNENIQLRVSPTSFEDINVKISSGMVKLGEIAQVEVKSANLYIIDMISQPENTKAVFDAILKSKLNSNPTLEKSVISLPIAKISREHREKLSKIAKAKSEQAIKKIRDAESKALRKAKENKSVSSDLVFNVSEHVKYQYELFSKEANAIRDAKIKEILQE